MWVGREVCGLAGRCHGVERWLTSGAGDAYDGASLGAWPVARISCGEKEQEKDVS